MKSYFFALYEVVLFCSLWSRTFLLCMEVVLFCSLWKTYFFALYGSRTFLFSMKSYFFALYGSRTFFLSMMYLFAFYEVVLFLLWGEVVLFCSVWKSYFFLSMMYFFSVWKSYFFLSMMYFFSVWKSYFFALYGSRTPSQFYFFPLCGSFFPVSRIFSLRVVLFSSQSYFFFLVRISPCRTFFPLSRAFFLSVVLFSSRLYLFSQSRSFFLLVVLSAPPPPPPQVLTFSSKLHFFPPCRSVFLPPNVETFLGTILYDMSSTGIFFTSLNFCVLNEIFNFNVLAFYIFRSLSILLSIVFPFSPILVVFRGLGKIKKSKMADPRWRIQDGCRLEIMT